MSEWTHLDEQGRAKMVDVSEKQAGLRVARACGSVLMESSTLQRIVDGAVPKGDVLAVARVAGIMAAKQTPTIIPLCHPVSLSGVTVHFDTDVESGRLEVSVEARATDRTGVEMEALTAVMGACLCIYDMCKAVDRSMVISEVLLLEKRGGRSGTWLRPA